MEGLKTAVPELNGAVPRTFELSLKVTFPVGVTEEDAVGLTVATKLICCPNTEGLMETARAVVVGVITGVSRRACMAPPFTGCAWTMICPLSFIPTPCCRIHPELAGISLFH